MCKGAHSCPTLGDPVDWSLSRLLRPWNFPGKNTAVGCHAFLQGIFLAQGWNPGLILQADSLLCEPSEKPTFSCVSHVYGRVAVDGLLASSEQIRAGA